MHMGFVFVLKTFQDKCNRDCNRDRFVITFNAIVLIIDYIVILFIRNRNRAGGK